MLMQVVILGAVMFVAVAGGANGQVPGGGAGGYRTAEKSIRPETVKTLRLEATPVSTVEFGISPVPMQVATQHGQTPKFEGFQQYGFMVQGSGALEFGGMKLFLDLVATAPDFNPSAFKQQMLTDHPEQFKVRVIAAGGMNYEELSEPQTLAFEPIGESKAVRATGSVEVKAVRMPDGTPLKAELKIFSLPPNPNAMPGMPGFSPYGQQPGAGPLMPRMQARLPLSAQIPGPEGELILALQPANRLNMLRGYSIYQKRPEGLVLGPGNYGFPPEMVQDNERDAYMTVDPYRNAKMDQPFNVGGEWWMIAAVSSGLTTMTIAQPAEGAVPNFTGQVGQTAPDWTRVDLISRQLIMRSDAQTKYLVLVFAGQNSQDDRFNGYRLVAERLKQESGGKALTLFVENNIQFDDLFAATAGLVDLPYAVVGNVDPMFQRNGPQENTLRKLMWVGDNNPVTFLMAPDGKIVLREEKALLESLAPVVMELRKIKGQ